MHIYFRQLFEHRSQYIIISLVQVLYFVNLRWHNNVFFRPPHEHGNQEAEAQFKGEKLQVLNYPSQYLHNVIMKSYRY